jgi:ankyrin repeat protein
MPIEKYSLLLLDSQFDALYQDLSSFIHAALRQSDESFLGQNSIREIDMPFNHLERDFKHFQESQPPQFPQKNHDLFSLNIAKRNTLLHKAVEKEDALLARVLINARLDINRENFLGETPLSIACAKKKEALVKLLLDFKADPNANANFNENKDVKSPLYIAIDPENPMLTSIDKTASLNIVKMLIAAGANVNEQSGRSRFAAIHYAVMDANVLLVKEMLKSGKTDLSLVDIDGNGVLHMVSDYRSRDEQEKERDKMSREGQIAKLLISRSDAINQKNNLGNNPLHTAIICGNRYVVRHFLKKDYLFPQMKILSMKNKEGMTPIHEAVREIKRGSSNLMLLLRVASREDLAIQNNLGETAIEMANRLHDQGMSLKQHINSLFERTREIIDNRQKSVSIKLRDLGSIATKLIDIATEKKLSALNKKSKTLANAVIQLLAEIKEFDDDSLLNNLHSSEELNSKANELFENIKSLPEEFSEHIAYYDQNYFNGLNRAKKLLQQSAYLVWKEAQLRLPTSFPNLVAEDVSVSYDVDEELDHIKRLYGQGIDFYESGNYQEAKNKLAEVENKLVAAVHPVSAPEQALLANTCWFLGIAYHELADPRAENSLKKSISYYLDLEEESTAELLYEKLARININAGKTAEYEASLKSTLEESATNKQKLMAHLGLAALYKTIKEGNLGLAGGNIFSEDLFEHESFHYSEAYKLTQGDLDDNAHVVLQREIGVAKNAKLGTYNIQQCVVAVAYDPDSKKVVLSHFDKLSGPLTFIDQLLDMFPPGIKIDLYLSGGRDRSNNNIATSDSNIDQVLKQIYAHERRFNLKSTDLGNKPSPIAIVFDPQYAKLIASMPNHADISLESRAAKISLPLFKEGNIDYLYPLDKVDFSVSEAKRPLIYTTQQKERLFNAHKNAIQYKLAHSNAVTEAWNHNQIIYPSMMASKNTIGPRISFKDALLKNFAQFVPVIPDPAPLQKPVPQQQRQRQNPEIIDLYQNNQRGNVNLETLAQLDIQALNTDFSYELPAKRRCRRQKRWEENNCLHLDNEEDEPLNVKEEKYPRYKMDSSILFEHLSQINVAERRKIFQKLALYRIAIVGEKKAKIETLIRAEQSKFDLEKVSTLSKGLMNGIMAKDMLSDLLNGRFGNVVMNVGFLGSSHAFGRLGELAVNTGEKLLERGSSTRLAKALRISGPFISRASSAFIALDLSQQISVLKAAVKIGDDDAKTDALVNIVGDSINIGVDLVEAGIEIAEITGVIAGVSSVAGPVGETVGAIVILGMQIYSAVREIERLDHLVHLSDWEKFKEGWRAFLGMAPENYVQNMVELVQAHNQLLLQKLIFLQRQPHIKHLVFPALKQIITNCHTVKERAKGMNVHPLSVLSRKMMINSLIKTKKDEGLKVFFDTSLLTMRRTVCDTEFPFINNSNINLRERAHNFKLTRAQPINLAGSEFICLPTGNDISIPPGPGAYRCDDAIGITDTANKTGDSLLFDLGDGDDFVKGFINTPNIFIARNGFKKFYGGKKDDIFIVQANSIEGDFNGKEGINTLDLSGFTPIEKFTTASLYDGFMGYKDKRLGLRNIHHFIGSKQQELLIPACDSQQIDTQGAVTPVSDIILILRDDDCYYNITFFLRPNTNVTHENFTEGSFSYFIYPGKGIISIGLGTTLSKPRSLFNNTLFNSINDSSSEVEESRNSLNLLQQTKHQIFFNSSLHDLEQISFDSALAINSTQEEIRFNFLSCEIRELLKNIKSICVNKTDLVDEVSVHYHLKRLFSSAEQESGLLNSLNKTQYQQVLAEYPLNLSNNSSVCLSNRDEIRRIVMTYLISKDALNSIKDYSVKLNAISPNTFFYFNDGIELKIGHKKNVYALCKTNKNIDFFIKTYSPVAWRLNISFFISTRENDVITIGGGNQHQVLFTDNKAIENHMVGSQGENVFVINCDTHGSIFDMQLGRGIVNRITIYPIHNSKHINTIDFRPFAKKVRTRFNETLEARLYERNQYPKLSEDLTLEVGITLYEDYSYSSWPKYSYYPLLRVYLKEALIDYWHKKLHVILNVAPQKIVKWFPNMNLYSSPNFGLEPIPLEFDERHSLIILGPNDIEKNTVLRIDRKFDHYAFFRDGANLILTNTLAFFLSEQESCQILLEKFYQENSNLESLSIEFLDKKIFPSYLTEINQTADFNRAWMIRNQIVNSLFFEKNNSALDLAVAPDQSNKNSSLDKVIRVRRAFIDQSLAVSERSMSAVLGTIGGSTLALGLTILGCFFSIRYFREGQRHAVSSKSTLLLAATIMPPKLHQAEAIKPPVRDERGLVVCHSNTFKEDQCAKNQLLFGTLGYCANENTVLVWLYRAEEALFYYAISVPYISKIDASQERVFFNANSLYFSPHLNSCSQVIRLESMNSVSLSSILTEFPVASQLLYNAEQEACLKQSRHDAAIEHFTQSAQEISWVYFGEHCFLHTVAGDYFRAVGLAPDWDQHDPGYLLRRVVKSVQANNPFPWNSKRSILAFFLELMLLVPTVKARIAKESYRSKLVVRFIADLLQFGFSVSTCAPSLVEFLVYQYPWGYKIAMGLRAALSMLEVINDPSTWYLVVGLFVLPQLSSLLENLGIPVTSYINHALESLQQLFISCSLWVSVEADLQRLERKKIILQIAGQRVDQGRERVSHTFNSMIGFFRNPQSANDDTQQETRSCQTILFER